MLTESVSVRLPTTEVLVTVDGSKIPSLSIEVTD